MGSTTIARTVGLARHTVRRYLPEPIDQRLVRELATGRFLAQADNVLFFGAPAIGKTHLVIALDAPSLMAGIRCSSRARWRCRRPPPQRKPRPARRPAVVLQ